MIVIIENNSFYRNYSQLTFKYLKEKKCTELYKSGIIVSTFVKKKVPAQKE